MKKNCGVLALLLALTACKAATDSGSSPNSQQQTGGMGGAGGLGGSGGSSSGGMGGVGGMGGMGGALATGGMGGGAPPTGGSSSGGMGGMGGSGGSIDAGAIDASDTIDAAPPDLTSYASGLHELFIDVPCVDSTPLPLADGATCDHPPNTQRIEREVTFGGDPSTTYAVRLRVRGIWEPTMIQGGEAPEDDLPFKIGGTIAPGNPIDYQQYFIEVGAPAQTYWLNDHQYVAHDIHKLDYEATIEVQGGATVTVVMNDGNERQIANWTEDYFEGLEPYADAPSTGQMLRLDVVSVSE